MPQFSLQLTFMAGRAQKVYGVYAITLSCPDEFPPCLSEPELLFEEPRPGLLIGSTLSWSPDGKRLALVSGGKGEKLDIYLIDWNGQNPVNLTNSPASENFPAWSPDGSWISFDSCGHEGCQIFRIQPDGTHREQLLRLADVNNPSEPGWSPDGSQLTFIGYDESLFPAHIYAANLDGSSLVQVTHQESRDSYTPAFSSDGHWILFARDVSVPDNLGGLDPNIFLVKSDGSGATWLAKDVWANQLFPSWSPWGDWITFSSDNYDEDKYDLYLIKPDGTHMINVTNTPKIPEGSPAWRIVRTP
jgi:Tol biopolymer transport system component